MGGTSNSGIDLDQSAKTLTIKVNSVNDAPAGTDKTVNALKSTDFVFTTANFGLTDTSDIPANTLLAVTISTLPTAGTLNDNGSLVTAGQSIPVTDITGGLLKFSPAAGAVASPYATFTFQVQDNGGTAFGGIDLDQSPNTLTINVIDPTILGLGDIAFTGYQGTTDDKISFVLLKDVNAATVLTVTDDAWTGAAPLATNEGTSTITFGAAFTAGTQFNFDAARTAGARWAVGSSAANLSEVTTSNFALNGSGDNLFAYNGSTAPTSGSDSAWVAAFASNAFLTTGSSSTSLSYLPSAFTLGDNAFSLGLANAAGNENGAETGLPSTVTDTAAGIRAQLYDVSKWTTFTTAGAQTIPPSTIFIIGSAGVNHAPAGADKTLTINEDAVSTLTAADFGFTDPNDTSANSLLAVEITTLPAGGTLAVTGGPALQAGDFVTKSDIDAGKLTFKPALNANGTGYTSFKFQIQDDGGTTGGGVDLDQSPNTITFNVTSINDAPAGTDITVTATEDTDYVFVASNFGLTDNNDSPANALLAVEITTLPGAGSLNDNGAAVTAGQFIPVADINGGLLKFTPASNANGSGYASFTFQVQDDGGTAAGGVDLDASANTLTIDVTAVNDLPVAQANSVTTNEDTAKSFAPSDFLFTDVEGNSLASITVSSLTLASGDTLTVDQGSGAVAVTNGMTITAAQIASLTFTPAANANGSARSTFNFTVNDASNGTVAATMTINLTAVNDVPVAQASSVTTNEDTAKTFAVSDFQFTDVEGDSLASITVSSLTLASGDTLTVDQGSGPVAVTNGMTITAAQIASLTYTPAANANGSARSTFSFKVNDAGNGTVAATMNINVTAVNDVPVAQTSNVTTNEDTAKTFAVSDFQFTDIEGNSLSSITVSGLTLASGDTLTVDQGSGPVAVTNGMTITAAQIASLTYTPAANANGAARSTFSFTVNDSGSGTVSATMTINVTAVNDAPTIAINRTLTLNPGQSVAISNAILLATDPDNTASQLTYTVTTNPAKGTITKNGVAVTTLTQNDLNAGDALASAIRYTATTAVAGDTDLIVLSLTDGTSTPITVTINISIVATATANYTGNYSQNFDNLSPTPIPGNNSSLPAAMILPQGWLASETGTNASNSVRFDNGGQSTGDSYLFGATDSNERALGTQSSGSNTPVRIGVALTNTTGSTITSLNVTYIGEQWRKGGGTTNKLTFDYSTSATSLSSGTYTAVTGLNFTAPEAGSNGPLDGNSVANQQAVSGIMSGFSWAPGATIYLRWTDIDDTGSDDSLAIDGLSITTANNAPTAQASSVTTNEDTAKTFATSDFQFTDVEGNGLSSIVVNGLALASGDTLTVNQGAGPVAVTNGMTITAAQITSLTYTPAASANGSARSTFSFTVNDAGIGTLSATMSINVNAVNDVPVAQASSVTTNEDTAKAFAVSDFLFTDLEGNSLASITVSGLTLAGGDTLTVDQGSGPVAVSNGMTITAAQISTLTYTPAANANGAARSSFSFTVNDAGTGIVAATMSVNVNPVNDVPVAQTSSVTTNEDTAKTFAVSDFLFTDLEGDSLASITVSGLALAAGDTLTVDQGAGPVAVTNGMTITAAQIASLTYSPAANANGSARSTFSFKANDAGSGTVTATMSINVNAVNDVPVALASSVSTVENTSKTFAVSNFPFTDVEGDSLTSITISGLSLASGDTLTVDQGSGPVAVTNGMTITAAQIASLTYTPATDATGSPLSTFSFKVNDSGAGTVAATMSINVTFFNNLPVAQASSVATNEDTNKTFAVSDFLFTDVEGDSLASITVGGLTLASGDTLTVDQGAGPVAVANGMTITAAQIASLTYSPAANANGVDRSSFSFTVNDAGNGTVSAIMSINVTAVNDVPVALTSSVSTNEDTSRTFPVADFLFTDVEGDSLASITISGLTLASNDTLTVDQGAGPIAVTNGMTVTAAQIATLTYTPATNANGSARSTFSFKVNDSGAGTIAATMTINVTAVNDVPVAQASSVTTNEDTPKSFSVADFQFTDIEDDSLASVTVSGLTLASGDTLTVNQGAGAVAVSNGMTITAAQIASLTYTPAANANGSARSTFNFKVNDTGAGAVAATMTINMTAVNDAPVAQASSVTTNEDTAKTFSISDFHFTDIEGDSLASITVGGLTLASGDTLTVDQGAGPVAVANGMTITAAQIASLTYSPAANANGTDRSSFDFAVNDAGSGLVSATMSINVTAVNDVPVALASSVSTNEDTSKTFAVADFLFTDVEGNSLASITISGLALANGDMLTVNQGSGQIAVTNGMTITAAQIASLDYSPAANGNGVDRSSFSFKVNDTGSGTVAATMSINVTPVNDV
ncbi:MAG: hypothetical protein JWM11_49, partial [Planctomycetaceae bacterium]|nr:hypothetical protein [Planctomycetaceae bacterium]